MKIFGETTKSEEKTDQTEEEIPEEGLNTKFYTFFDRLSKKRNFLPNSLHHNT
jgi:hypothetical protein